MKRCDECKINVKDNAVVCPLCLRELINLDGKTEREIYPELLKIPPYNFLMRLLIFLSVAGAAASVVVNVLTDASVVWSISVVSAIAYFWASIKTLLKKNSNAAFKIFVQTIFTSALCVIMEAPTGKFNWSLSYALPSIFTLGSIIIIVIIIVNRTNWANYVIYQCLIAVFGFVPALFYWLKISNSLAASAISVGVSFLSLLTTFVFGDRTIKNEFIRRFHI
jgi:lysylphosphatidylglycerol synthetase-like protein (DUF2156 family)